MIPFNKPSLTGDAQQYILESIESSKIPKNNSYKELITFVEDRVGHDRRYAIDATKLENKLGWEANENFDSGIVKTIEWYLGKYL
jgi:dTDP-glucose 4,6-dehydratase